MAAGLGFKTFTTGEVLTAADVNGYLMQGILVFANAAARSSAITSPQEGQYSFLKDTNALEYYDGAAWVGAPVGDITSVTAGTGISGGGSSGDVTITNSMATAIDAKGDLIAGTGADAFSRLPVGSDGQTLVADSSTATGLKWAAAAGGGKVLQVVTATTATTVTVASTTFADSGLTCNITPSSTSSKVLVIVQQNLYTTRDPADRTFAKLRLMRGATSLFSSDYFFGTRSSSATREAVGTFSVAWLDAPSTTSATTYKTQIAALDTANSGEVKGQYGNSTSSIVLLEIGA